MTNQYVTGEYLERHPNWHEEDSAWKASQILKLIERNKLRLSSISEVGCGAGEILRRLSLELPQPCRFDGYDISPQAYAISREKQNEKLRFFCEDYLGTPETHDGCLLIDVIEHIEDYFGFLRKLKTKSTFKILHIPLDIHAQGVMRNALIGTFNELGHLHFFTRDTAIRSLQLCGYEVLDWFYTNQATGLPPKRFKARIARIPRIVSDALSREFTVRALGGFSLMVLAK